jgi:hypothetical protein
MIFSRKSIPEYRQEPRLHSRSGPPMNAPSHVVFRISASIFAAVLGLQCVWLLLADLSRAEIDRLPPDAQSADFAAKQRNNATWAAWLGAIRGDLWADSAFTFADLLWANPGSDLTSSLNQVYVSLDRAVDYAPHQSGAWLLLSGLASQHQWTKVNAAEALKVSYYTAPNDLTLLPLRLLIAAESEAISDAEIQQFVRRDLRLLLARKQKSAVTEAYQHATLEGRNFIEQALNEIDPAYLTSLRSGAQRP